MAKKRVLQSVKPHLPQPEKKRDIEAVRQEYFQLCAQAGEREYKIQILRDELKNCYERLLVLNREAADIKPVDSGKPEVANG